MLNEALKALSGLPNIRMISERFPVALADFQCSLCGAAIPAGTQYWRLVYRDRDARDRKHNMRTSRIHLKCPEGL